MLEFSSMALPALSSYLTKTTEQVSFRKIFIKFSYSQDSWGTKQTEWRTWPSQLAVSSLWVARHVGNTVAQNAACDMIHSSNMSHSAQNNLLHTDIYMPPVTTMTCHTTNHTCAIWLSRKPLYPGPKLLYDYIQCFMPTRKSVDLTLYFPCLLIGSVLPINCQ